MKIKLMLLAAFCSLIFLAACNTGELSNNVPWHDIRFIEVQAHNAAAYYLSEDGTLYSPGADSDATSYIVYQKPKKHIVAENVKCFEEVVGGGCYIDSNNDVYLWNEDVLPLWGYTNRKKHTKILSNVTFVAASGRSLIYIDTDSNLYLLGSFKDEVHHIDKPKLLDKDVVSADINSGSIVWARTDGGIDYYGDADLSVINSLNTQFAKTEIENIKITKESILILCENELWFYGDYQKLVTGKESQLKQLIRIGDKITKFSASWRTVAALDKDGNVLLWGRCVSNDLQNITSPQYQYYKSFCLAQDARNVFVSDSCVCYIDSNNHSCIYYSSGWPSLYGNSTSDPCVGINRKPSTWVDKGTVLLSPPIKAK